MDADVRVGSMEGTQHGERTHRHEHGSHPPRPSQRMLINVRGFQHAL